MAAVEQAGQFIGNAEPLKARVDRRKLGIESLRAGGFADEIIVQLGCANAGAHAGEKFFEIERLGDEVVDAGVVRFQQPALFGMGRENDEMNRRLSRAIPDGAAERQTIRLGHDPIGNDDARIELFPQRQRLFAVGSSEDRVTGCADQLLQFPEDERIIVGNEDRRRARAGGFLRYDIGNLDVSRRSIDIVAQALPDGHDLAFSAKECFDDFRIEVSAFAA